VPLGDPVTGPPDKQAYDELPDGVVVADDTGTVVLLNAAGVRILGRSTDEVVGRPLAEALPLVDAQGRDWWSCTRPYDGLSTRTRQPERRLTVRVPGAEEREVFVSARYVREGGRVVRVVVAFRDTASRDRLERSGSELVSTVAHELRSPLTSVKGFTATLLTKWDRFNDEQKKLMLQTVNADADRVTRLISELLDVSRIESGRLELRRQVVDVPAAVEKAVAGRVAAGEPRERFRLDVTGELPEMWLDPDKLDQVIGNLIENALRHGAGTVSVSVGPHGDGVEVLVADEGQGVAPEATSRIFTKFWRGNRRGGTGLGLYIARGIVEAHGGSIEARQAPNGGALFRFVLPAGTPSFAR
jgi:PAS domain S-box-containing protein